MNLLQYSSYVLAVWTTVLLHVCSQGGNIGKSPDVKLNHRNEPEEEPLQIPITKNRKLLLKLAEKTFMNIMGLTTRPGKKMKRKIKIPDYLWKLYYKWSDKGYEDYDKSNADTARVIHHDGKLYYYL